MKTPKRLLWGILLCTLLIHVTACGGGGGGGGSVAGTGGSGGIGGSGRTSSGSITGFGSIFVNGVEHDISVASCDIDGESHSGDDCQDNLRIGMVVTVRGSVDGSVGSAETVVYDSVVEGPVAAGSLVVDPDGLRQRFAIFGLQLRADRNSTVFDDTPADFGFDTLAEGNVLEVSGFYNAAEDLVEASYIRLLSAAVGVGAAVELKGLVSEAPAAGAAAGDSFQLAGVTINLSASTQLGDMPGAVVGNGNSVEVHGIYIAANTVEATRVEPEDGLLAGEGEDIDLQGVVSAFVDLSNFRVAGLPVDASAAALEPSTLNLRDGLKVEVEGSIVNGVLRAAELELRSNDIKLSATVADIDTAAALLELALGDARIVVRVNNQTRMEDKLGADSVLSLSELAVGDFLELSGFVNADGELVASDMRRDSADDILLRGPVDAGGIAADRSSVRVLGVGFMSADAPQTRYLRQDIEISKADFFDQLAAGVTIKINDAEPYDGIADEIELED